MKKFRTCLALGLLPLISILTSAQTLDTNAVRDNTIYSEGALSNGQGDFLFSGLTTGNAGPTANRRALIEFDVSSIPSTAVISDVTFFIEMDRRPPGVGAHLFALHRLTNSWGEGSSDAPGAEGGGTAAAPGDATWTNNFEGTSPWLSLGGDFDPVASAVEAIDDLDNYTFTAPGLVADVQGWVNGSIQNNGWILIGDENPATGLGSARRFVSQNDFDQSPRLLIEYQTIPEPSGFVLLISGILLLRKRFVG